MAGIDPSDAAILAQPLYRPSSVAGALRGPPQTSDEAAGRLEEARVPDLVTAQAEGQRDPGAMTRPAVTDRAPRPAPSGTTLPPAGQPTPLSTVADPPPAVPRPAAEGPVAARPPHRSASAGASPAPALPASDLERLDEAGLHEQPAAPTVPAPPNAAALLLGGLAALSIVGLGRRRPAGHASEGRRA